MLKASDRKYLNASVTLKGFYCKFLIAFVMFNIFDGKYLSGSTWLKVSEGFSYIKRIWLKISKYLYQVENIKWFSQILPIKQKQSQPFSLILYYLLFYIHAVMKCNQILKYVTKFKSMAPTNAQLVKTVEHYWEIPQSQLT